MTAIYKYSLGRNKLIRIEMPKGAEVLCVKEQHESGCIWALVDLERPPEIRIFKTILTGEEFEYLKPFNTYLGTYQLHGGNYICHVFEVKEPTV